MRTYTTWVRTIQLTDVLTCSAVTVCLSVSLFFALVSITHVPHRACPVSSDILPSRTGERKSKLTAAVLSDHHSSRGKGQAGGDSADADHEDIGAIGRILQKALQKNREKQLQGVNDDGQGPSTSDTVDSAIRQEEM